MIDNISEIISVLVAVLVAIQAVVNYVLPPEKAVKYNWIGKVLEFLSKTKSGLSPKVAIDVKSK
jgi:hypothetical protein